MVDLETLGIACCIWLVGLAIGGAGIAAYAMLWGLH